MPKINPKTTNLINESIKQAIEESRKPLLLAHARPDGDAIGSVLGLGLALQNAGKSPLLVFSDGLPKSYRFLQGSEQIATNIDSSYDLVIALDCANYERLSTSDTIEKVHINIDHHVTNEQYADINLVLPEYASTTSILAQYLTHWGLALTKDIADALLMGMITDTIGFRTNNVTPAFLRIAADLVDLGADLAEMYHQSLTMHSPQASRIWGFALARLELEGNLAWTSILIKDRDRAGYTGMDDADLTNHLSSIEKIDVSVLFNEQKDGTVKVSWRSSAKYDVTRLAALFGGGGHPQASGAQVEGALEAVKLNVLEETKKLIEGNQNNTEGI